MKRYGRPLMILALLAFGYFLFHPTRLLAEATATASAPSPTMAVPDAVASAQEIVTPIIQYLKGIPKVGPVVSFVAQLLGVIGTLFTALTVFLTLTCKTLSAISQLSGLAPLADKIQAFHDKAWRYFAYLSIFNVQKPEAPALPPKV